MGKDKKAKKSLDESQDAGDGELSYEDRLKFVSIISKPMASKKLSKKVFILPGFSIFESFDLICFTFQLYKCIKKGMAHKTYIRNGLKDVQARIRKGESGIVVFAGDVTPIEVMCHLPAVCEEKQLPYVYTPSRQLLGSAMGVKRGSLMVLIREHEEYKDLFDECKTEIQALPPV